MLLILVGTCCLVQWGAGDLTRTEGVERVILYTVPGADIVDGLSFFQNSSISENCTIVLQAPELGFVVAQIPTNESSFYRNELSKISWITDIESDGIRLPEIHNNSPDDPFLSDQWALNRTHMSDAWDSLPPPSGIGNITVAIIDTGIDSTHEDLTGVLSDRGVDWVDNSSAPTDSDGHGTFLAGIVGAVSGNEIGISGVAPVILLPEKVGTNATGIFTSLSAVAIKHAADNGARIILMGYGGPGQSPAEEAAIRYAAKKGCILVAPAGNGASNEGHYPSDYSEVISVGSTAKTDGLSYFSNYGIFVELVAPGEGIVSTWPNNQYQAATGTSPAAALVAGTAALVLTADPTLNREEVREMLSSSSRDLGRTGRDIYYGYGLLDAGNAVKSSVNNRSVKIFARSESPGETNSSDPGGHGPLSGNTTVKRSGSTPWTTADISLQVGWNFISLPAVPASGKKSKDIFADINTDGHTIWKYNASVQDWIAIGKDTSFNPLEGFLIYSDRERTIPMVFDSRNQSPSVPVSQGWNLVGSPSDTPVSARDSLSSLSSDWVSLLLYNSSIQSYDPVIIQGASGLHADTRLLPAFSAYWVYMNKAGMYGSSS